MAHVGRNWALKWPLRDEVSDPFEMFLSADGQMCHLLHQLLEHLGVTFFRMERALQYRS